MREVLYRGKTDDGEWVYGDLIQLSEHDDYWYILPNGVSGEMYEKKPYPFRQNDVICEVALAKVFRETIGEYTGLTDKNGSKIFEGDIVCLNRIREHYIVKWNDTQCRFGLYQSGLYEQAGFNKDTMLNYEIIGNIHDNPELLTDKT